MRFFIQNQRFCADEGQENNFQKFGKQAQDFLQSIPDFFVTPLGGETWDTLEAKGTRWGTFLVTKTYVRGGVRFSKTPDFFDPSRLSPLLLSVPTGKTMCNVWIFIGSQAGLIRKQKPFWKA